MVANDSPDEMVRRPSDRFDWSDFTAQVVRTMVWCWPGTTRSLVIFLRVSSVAVAVLIVVGLWRATAVMPRVVDGLLATAACLAFAYCFERAADD